jgi:hypothetical protein
MSDKMLDEILERVKNDYPFGCANNVTDWAETACKMGANTRGIGHITGCCGRGDVS